MNRCVFITMKTYEANLQVHTERTHTQVSHMTQMIVYFPYDSISVPIFFALPTPTRLRILLSLVFLCVTVSQMSCIRLLTRCFSAWLSSPRLYVISPGVSCLCVYVRIRVRARGCGAESVCVVAAVAARNISKPPFVSGFLCKLCLSARTQIWHTDT